MTYPVGCQYFDLTGKGSFVGIADEILSINKLNRQKRDSANRIRLMRTMEMRDYKRESRARPRSRGFSVESCWKRLWVDTLSRPQVLAVA